jgi:hypothetical protein
MAFGKVVVQTEDGEEQIYELTNPTTSVGRQSGNDIVLNTTAVSRYHAQFDVAEGRVFLVDLGGVNGTFVNDRQITSNSRVELFDGDVITLGDVRLIFYPRQVRSDISLTPETIYLSDPDIPFRLVLESPLQPVAPGARLRLALVIENLTDQEQTYTVAVEGLEPKWAGVNRQQVRLEAYEQTEITISVRPPRSSETRPGIYPLQVRVALKDDPALALEATSEIDVVGFAGFGMVIQPTERNGVYNLVMQNQGNLPLGVKLGGYNRDKLLRYRFEPSEVYFEAGEIRQSTLTVHLAQPGVTGGARSVPFLVVARSLDSAGYQAPVLASYQPDSSRRVLLAGLLGLPVLLLISVAALAAIAAIVYFGRVIPGFGPPAKGAEETALIAEEGLSAEAPAVASPGAPLATPTLIQVPPTATITLTPTEAPSPTVTPLALDDQPPGATLTFGEELAPSIIITFGTVRDVEFTWDIPEDVTGVVLLDDQGQEIELSSSQIEAGNWRVVLPELVRRVGWEEHTYTLTFSTAGGEAGKMLAALAVRAIACEMQNPAEVYQEPGFRSSKMPPLPSSSVVIVGRYTNLLNQQVWLRVAAYDADDLSTLAAHNHRWVPDGQITLCGGQPPTGFGAYAELRPDAVPPPPD